ncbi:unnamed protein product [Blepharisma stoltei]|uniref:Uncharacterized protein n=1 Tax=Blepharisma stoltei TaxID=1481888 RepID=A0AAU9J3F4_9CILI|nr:unnamed protein product [Blepharisma stoltei]
MNAYILDVSSPFVITALEELGISPRELLKKSLEDFAEPGLSQEFQSLRYDHYTNRLLDTAQKIRNFIKSHYNSLQSHIRHSSAPESQRSQSATFSQENSQTFRAATAYQNEAEKLNQIKEKNKELILSWIPTNFLDNSPEKSKSSESGRKIKKFTSQKHEVYLEHLKKFKEQQLAASKAIKAKEIKMQKELSNRLIKSMSEHGLREKLAEEEKKRKIKEREEIFKKKQEEIKHDKEMKEDGMEMEIKNKLNQFQWKIMKSEETHEAEIKKKLDILARHKEMAEIVAKNQEFLKRSQEMEVLCKIINKQESVKERRIQIKRKYLDEIKNRRHKSESKRQKAIERLKSQEKQLENNSTVLEKQLNATQQLISQKLSENEKELKLRQELQRLKNEDSNLEVLRSKRKFEKKNSEFLDKWLAKTQRIENFKKEKEDLIMKKRDFAIQAMIEKEKTKEIIAVLSKSPNSKTAQEKLKALNLIPKIKESETELN